MQRAPAILRADLHVHTYSSPDSLMTAEEIIAACRKTGINCLAVTDHNVIAGALEVARLAPFPVIVGEEIRTSEGEIIGLFLKEQIPRGLSPEESIGRIRAQGGLVLVPHPFDRLRRSTISAAALQRILPQVDIIEVFNARIMVPGYVSQAYSLAARHRLLISAGSDAHTRGEIGHGYVEMPEFAGPEGFLKSLAAGKVKGRPTSPLVHVLSTWNKWKKRRAARQRPADESGG
ncbi:MAG: PHP-associated domain-containing protein [Dehalococcoidia bacterium]|nr:PHP-associated domain-containing protein [Dehalococcoidia bacterium]